MCSLRLALVLLFAVAIAAASSHSLNATLPVSLVKPKSSSSISVEVPAQRGTKLSVQFYATLSSNSSCYVNVSMQGPEQFPSFVVIGLPTSQLIYSSVLQQYFGPPDFPAGTWTFKLTLLNGSCACIFRAIEIPTLPLVAGYGAQFNGIDPLGGIFYSFFSPLPSNLFTTTLAIPAGLDGCAFNMRLSYGYSCSNGAGSTTMPQDVAVVAGTSRAVNWYGEVNDQDNANGFWPANTTVTLFIQVNGSSAFACPSFVLSFQDFAPTPLTAGSAPVLIKSDPVSSILFGHFIVSNPANPYQLRANYVKGKACYSANWVGDNLLPAAESCFPELFEFIGSEYFIGNESHYEQPIAGPAGQTWIWTIMAFTSDCTLEVLMG